MHHFALALLSEDFAPLALLSEDFAPLALLTQDFAPLGAKRMHPIRQWQQPRAQPYIEQV